MTSERERVLNDATRRVLVRENYDSHFATLEERILIEDRLFLARWDALLNHLKLDNATLLPLAQTRWRNTSRGIEYTEIAHGEYISPEPALNGMVLVMYRDSYGNTFVRPSREISDGRYEAVVGQTAPPRNHTARG